MTAVNIIVFILILMLLVVIHEAGHMIVAKKCGMRVERFSIFFGKPIWSFKKGETEYGIGWLPLGGYVKINGMTRGEEMPAGQEHRAYYNAKPWKRIATILAGPAVNIVLAFVAFTAVFWIGAPTAVPGVTAVVQDSEAQRIGLQAGDKLIAINGVPIQATDTIATEIGRAPRQPVTLVIERDGRQEQLTGTPRPVVDEQGDTAFRLGINVGGVRGPNERSGFLGGIADGTTFGWELIEANGRAIGEVFTSSEAREQVGSVVAFAAVYNEVAEEGWQTILRYIGFVSMALGILNLLPLLPLDGGHILFTIIEKIKGSALPRRAYEGAALAGLAVILFIFIFALQNDIGRLTGEGFGAAPNP